MSLCELSSLKLIRITELIRIIELVRITELLQIIEIYTIRLRSLHLLISLSVCLFAPLCLAARVCYWCSKLSLKEYSLKGCRKLQRYCVTNTIRKLSCFSATCEIVLFTAGNFYSARKSQFYDVNKPIGNAGRNVTKSVTPKKRS